MQDPDEQLKAILHHYDRGEYPKVRVLSKKLTQVPGEYRWLGLQYLGLSYYLEERYSEALPFLQQVARESDSRTDHFNLLMCAVYTENPELEQSALRALNRASANKDSERPSPPEGLFRMYYCEALLETGRLD